MGIKTIRHIAPLIPLNARVLLLHALVLSHYNYGCMLLNNINQARKDKFERQLNWGLRTCYRKPARFNATIFG